MTEDKKLFSESGECYGESEITCPACGWKHSDSWEYDESNDDMECPDCGRHFSMERDVTVDYTTRLLDCNPDGDCENKSMVFDRRSSRKKSYERTGPVGSGKWDWVDIPKDKWTIQDFYRCARCASHQILESPYSEEQDPDLNRGLTFIPLRVLEGAKVEKL